MSSVTKLDSNADKSPRVSTSDKINNSHRQQLDVGNIELVRLSEPSRVNNTSFSPKMVDEIHRALTEAIDNVAQQYGVQLKRTASENTDTEMGFYVFLEGGSRLEMDNSMMAYLEVGKEFGLDPAWIGKTFSVDEQYMRASGLQNIYGDFMVRLTDGEGNHHYIRIAAFQSAMKKLEKRGILKCNSLIGRDVKRRIGMSEENASSKAEVHLRLK